VSDEDHGAAIGGLRLARAALAILLAGAVVAPGVSAAESSVPVVAAASSPSMASMGAATAQRAGAAEMARLNGQAAQVAARSSRDAQLIGRAALDASAAVQPLAVSLSSTDEPHQLGAAVERLAVLVTPTSTVEQVSRSLERSEPLPAEGATVAATSTALAESAAIAAAASEVFRLSMEVESLAQEIVDAQTVTPTERVAAVESAAEAALAVAAELEASAPLVPLAEDELAEDDVRRVTTGHAAIAALVGTWVNGAIPADELCPIAFAPGHLLQCDAADSLALLNTAYRLEFGSDLVISSSYRTVEAQAAIRSARGALAAPPGRSNHGWGLAVDLGAIGGLGDFTSPRYAWLKENADAFGWHHPRVMEPGGAGPQEPWHWEYGIL
jgi:hypothetical protein